MLVTETESGEIILILENIDSLQLLLHMIFKVARSKKGCSSYLCFSHSLNNFLFRHGGCKIPFFKVYQGFNICRKLLIKHIHRGGLDPAVKAIMKIRFKVMECELGNISTHLPFFFLVFSSACFYLAKG